MKTRIRKDIERIVGSAGFNIANTEVDAMIDLLENLFSEELGDLECDYNDAVAFADKLEDRIDELEDELANQKEGE